MNRFDYRRTATLEEALNALSEPGTSILAGGTNLLDLMKIGVARPQRLVDISRISALNTIDWQADGSVRVGAMVRNSDLAYDARFSKTFPMVSEALLSGASAQLRNAATVGGNLLQKTRCAYFQDTASRCNRRDPGSGCDALQGLNRLHAVLGWSEHCIATHPSDFCVALTALDASVELAGPSGTRMLSLESFYRLPGDHPEQENELAPGEIIVALYLPAIAASFSGLSRYLKLRERTSYAFAVVSAAAALTVKNGTIEEARLCLGAVAAKPWRVRDAEEFLKGKSPSPVHFEEAAAIALSGAQPSGQNAFKIELARRIVNRALLSAHQGTPERYPALPASPFSTIAGDAHVA